MGYIAFVTLSPLGLRPVGVPHHPMYDRLLAYGMLGLLFRFGYPGRLWMPICIVIGAAIGLEGLQLLTPDRHAQLPDLAAKTCGGLLGLLFAGAIIKHLAKS